MRVYPIGCFSLVASHKLHSVDCIPQVTFPRFIPKAHSKGSSRTAHLIVSRVAFHEAYKLLHSDIMPIHGDHQTWPPTPKKSTFRAAIEQTYAHNGRVNNLRFFSLQEALQFLCRGKEQSRIAGRTRAPSEPSNSYHLRAFLLAISMQSASSAPYFSSALST